MASTSKTQSNKIFCLIGPSGTGKTTLARATGLPEVVSYRTRDMREGEVDGVDGHFISVEEYHDITMNNLWIASTKYGGNYYGITQGEILDLMNYPMVYVIDWDGVLTLREAFEEMEGYDPKDIVSIYIDSPEESLEARMRHMKRDPEEIKVRLNRIALDHASKKFCDYTVENNNGFLETALVDILRIVLKENFSVGERGNEDVPDLSVHQHDDHNVRGIHHRDLRILL